jgi:hypothetical protein
MWKTSENWEKKAQLFVGFIKFQGPFLCDVLFYSNGEEIVKKPLTHRNIGDKIYYIF